MTRRDQFFVKSIVAIVFAIFGRLLLRPWLVPGNFGDIYGYHYPLRHLVASTLQAGRLPLWNPYIFAGTPLAANPQAVLFYPGSVLHYFFPLSWALTLDCFFHSLLASAGAFLLLRKWRIDSLGAWTLSLCFGLSPFLIYRISQGVPTLLAALSWAPWVWLAAASGSALTLGGAIAIQILSGHAQFCAINLVALGLWILAARRESLPVFVRAGLIAACLSAAQIVPTIQFLRHSVRSIWTAAFSTGYSLRAEHLLTFLFPNIWGNPFQADFHAFPSEFFELMTGYIGLLPLCLGIYAVIRLKPSRIWALIAAAGVFFALGQNNPLFVGIQRITGLDFFRIPARFSFLILWSLWIAAAFGWKELRPKLSWSMTGALAVLGVIDLLCWSAPWVYAQRPADFLSSNPEIIRAISDSRYRVATSPDVPGPNKAMLRRIYNATGYEAFYLAPIAVYTSKSEKGPAADGSRTYIQKWSTPEMSDLAVRFYVSTEKPSGARAPILEAGNAFVYENSSARQLAYGDGSGPIEWSMPAPEHWIASGSLPQNVTFSQVNYPGWTAWINGVRAGVKDRDGMLPSVSAPAGGAWTIHFLFRPQAFYIGLVITILSIASVVAHLLK